MRHARLAFVLAVVLFPAHLSAAFHFMSIKEVYGGSASAPNARYVMLQMYFPGQNFVAGHSLLFSDGNGLSTSPPFTFMNNVANGNDQATILIATPEAVALFGVAADLQMTAAALVPAGGKVCFDEIDCVAWGNYTGGATGVGAPFNPAGGITSGQAARRRLDVAGSPNLLEPSDDTNDSANDFRFAPPRPRNNAGQTATFTATTTMLASSLNPSTPGDPVTFTATVTPEAATGSVTFMDGATVLGTGQLGSSATFTTSLLSEGAHSITAVYEGDAMFNGSTSPAVMQVVAAATLAAPAMFSAAATSSTSVALSWSPVSNATGYEVYRATSVTGGYALAASTSSTATVDGLPVSGDTTYLYKVRALGSGGPSTFSAVDIATTTIFDDPSLAGVLIKATHVMQARTAINAMRVAAAVSPATFTDAALAGVVVKAVHIAELRTALDEARAMFGFGATAYTDPTLTAGETTVKADHVLQLRAATQ